jgi:putative transcriptional regulator
MLVVACHVERCGLCRDDVATWESVGGRFLEDTSPEPLSGSALATTLAAIASEDVGRAPAQTERPRLPRYLERFSVPRALADQSIGFRRWATPNIWFAPINVGQDSGTCYLVFGRAKTVLSRHTHKGREFTNVIYGSFHDDSGTFGLNDFEEADDSLLHAPTVTAEGDCLCIASAQSPMQFVGWRARMVQAALGELY